MKKPSFKSYDDFLKRWHLDVPEHFNFAFDVVDQIALEDPQRRALVHVDDMDQRTEYDFAFFSRESARLAKGLASKGLKKGDRVMLILKRRAAYWFAVIGLH